MNIKLYLYTCSLLRRSLAAMLILFLSVLVLPVSANTKLKAKAAVLSSASDVVTTSARTREIAVPQAEDIVSVIHHGIPNDGTPIGPELNELVRQSYGKTIYFPAGRYNLTEPIVTPMRYELNVNLLLDKNATLYSDTHLEALLKVGYSELGDYDSHRLFSYVEGGQFDCDNADNGIMVNGLKQLVQLRNMTVFKGHKCHIRIEHLTNKGTGSSDTKIDNVSIQGWSSDEDSYGIYIDDRCSDCKISNTFIYSTGCAIVLKGSAGFILNNIHILSMNVAGGKSNKGDEMFKHTVGIRMENSGFSEFHEVYFDTTDRCFVMPKGQRPTMIIDKCIFYPYIKNIGQSFICMEDPNETTLTAKMTGCIVQSKHPGFKVFDVGPEMIKNDAAHKLTFLNSVYMQPENISPLCPSLMMRMRGETYASLRNRPASYDAQWTPLGAVAPSYGENAYRIQFDSTTAYDVRLRFDGRLTSHSEKSLNRKGRKIAFRYEVKDGYLVVLFRPEKAATLFPGITDLQGSGNFMAPPSKTKAYTPADYGLTL